MQQILKNRALGILYLFLKNNFQDLKHWYIPANICFSVPLLFLKLNKEITFYDIGFDIDLIIKKQINELKNSGVLLYDYFGRPWEIDKINIINKLVACVIHDCCLSYPVLKQSELTNNCSDLIIFSTGPKKVVDVAYGAIGYYKKNYTITNSNNNLNDSKNNEIHNTYQNIETLWNECRKNNTTFKSSLIHYNWIDVNENLVEPIYFEKVTEKMQAVSLHKETLNKIYDTLIPDELKLKNLSNVWRYHISVKERDFLLHKIFEKNLFAGKHYADCPTILGYNDNCKTSKLIDKHIVNLFNDFYYSVNQAEQTALIIKKLFHQKKIKPQIINIY